MNNLQREKEQLRLENLLDRINAMSPEERQNLKKKIAVRLRLNGARLEDLVEKSKELSKPIKVKMEEWQVVAMLLSHMFGGAIAGAILGAPEHTFAAAGMGIGAGFGAAIFNGLAFEERPVTNAVREFKNYINNRHIKKVTNNMNKDSYLQEGIIDMSAQGDYEDAEEYSNY